MLLDTSLTKTFIESEKCRREEDYVYRHYRVNHRTLILVVWSSPFSIDFTIGFGLFEIEGLLNSRSECWIN